MFHEVLVVEKEGGGGGGGNVMTISSHRSIGQSGWGTESRRGV